MKFRDYSSEQQVMTSIVYVRLVYKIVKDKRMNEILELEANMRENFGTGNTRKLRRKGYVQEKEITKHYRKPGFISTIIQLKIGDNIHKVLPKDVELHPITDIARHVWILCI